MKTFFNILQTIINIKHKNYPDDPFALLDNYYDESNINEESAHIIYLINMIFYEVNKHKHDDKYKNNASAKFSSLNQVLDNCFYKEELKETIFDIFSKSQKHYFAFSKLACIYKIKKYNTVVSDDLILNPLDISHKNTFMLIDNKSKYLFSLNDLITIIETSIGNSSNFFSEPLSPKNPYNKQQLTDATLYNIYFKMKHSGRLISILFHLFFLEEFNLIKFAEHHESFIREDSIKKYVFNSHFTTLHSSVLTMLKSNYYTNLYIIHEDFPKETLVNIFRPFLFNYFICNYDITGTSKIQNYKQILFYKLKYFYNYNKAFGRRHIKIVRLFKNSTKREYTFNTKHICFYKIPITNNVTTVTVVYTVNDIVNSYIDNRIGGDIYDDWDNGDDDDNDDTNNDDNDTNNDDTNINNDNTNNDNTNNDNDDTNNDEDTNDEDTNDEDMR